MKKLSLLLGTLCVVALMAGCGTTAPSDDKPAKATPGVVQSEAPEQKAEPSADKGGSTASDEKEKDEEKDEEKEPETASEFIRATMSKYVDKYFEGDAECTYLYGLNYVLSHNSRATAEESVDRKDLDWYYQKYGFEGFLDYVEYAYTTAGFDYSKYKEMYETTYDKVKTSEIQKTNIYKNLMLAPCWALTPGYDNFDHVTEISSYTDEYMTERTLDDILDWVEPDNTYDYFSTASTEEFFSDSNKMLRYCKNLYAKKDELFEKYENDEIMDPLLSFELKFRLFDPDKYNKQ